MEYKRWEDVLPLTDEDAEEKWRGEEDWARARHPGLFAQAPQGTPNLQDWPLVSAEKVRKNPLLCGCVACQIPCPNCTGRLCKRTCAPFVTAHRGHHCNECYKRLGRHGQADVLH